MLVGDEAADLLIEYAALLTRHDSADTVTLTAYGDDGDPVEATFLLNSGTSLVIESSESPVSEPDNAGAISYMRERMERLESPPNVQPVDSPPSTHDWEM